MLSLRIDRSPLLLAALLAALLVTLPAPPAGGQTQDGTQDGPVACPYCDLAGRDLSGQDLTDANLVGADLRGAILRGADLDGAQLIGAQLQGADLDDATLNPSELGPANLSRADLSGASLVGTEMVDANLQYTLLPAREGSITPQPAALSRARRGPGAVDRAARVAEETGCGSADLSGLTSRVHVSGPFGTDSQDCGATPETACATIAQGISRCAASGCGVLVEYGEYSLVQTLELRDGVSVYGGCLPASQAHPTYVSVIEAPDGGVPAVRAAGIESPTILQGFEIAASEVCAHLSSPSDCPSGAETVAVVVDGGRGLSILDSQLVASVGSPGGGGGDGAGGGSGSAGSGRSAGTNGSCSSTQGGAGGTEMNATYDTGIDWPSGDAYMDCDPQCAENNCYGFGGAAGGTGVSATGGSLGYRTCTGSCFPNDPGPGGGGGGGIDGACGAVGEASTVTAGSFSGLDWVPATGGDGGDGENGGGGGGGGAGGYQGNYCLFVTDFDVGNRGGGGGAGGCRGTGGAGGTQGGASFALVVRNAHVDLTGSSVVSGQGGPGGRGGQGGRGGVGGGGASGGTDEDGGDGGRGGNGGDGGSGAGGAGGNGGPTLGIALLDGATVADDDTAFYPGRSGEEGDGGNGGGAPSGDACQGPIGQEGETGTIVNVYDY